MLTRRKSVAAAAAAPEEAAPIKRGADDAAGGAAAATGGGSKKQQQAIPESEAMNNGKGKGKGSKSTASSSWIVGAKPLLLVGGALVLLGVAAFAVLVNPSATAAVRSEQEARVYERTGSRFFRLPHCPEEPEDPAEVPILDLLGNWNPDDVRIPARHHSTLCRIDYQAERAKALRYRDADVPFVVYNVPELDETVRKWAQPGYLEERFGTSEARYPVEISRTNHFLYVSLSQKSRDDYTQVTGNELPLRRAEWPFTRWVQEAQALDKAKADGIVVSRQQSHVYMYIADDRNRRIREDLTIFHHLRNDSALFVADPAGARLIECRFGMTGIVTEAHYDGQRNMAGVVSGMRRWILAHPRNCPSAYLRPLSDFSARQSQVDWAQPDLEKFPAFAQMRAHEVILLPGEVLHVPSWWLHYVVTLGTGAQCNAHCGKSEAGVEHIEACGFKRPTPKKTESVRNR